MAVMVCQDTGMTNTDDISPVAPVTLEVLDLMVTAAVESIRTATETGGYPAHLVAVSTSIDILETVLEFGTRSAGAILEDALGLAGV